MEEAIKQMKALLEKEEDRNARLAIKECIFIARKEYAKTLSPEKTIQLINELKTEKE